MIAETIPGLENLSAEQKLLLSAELWEEVTGIVDDARDEAIHALLKKRWEEFEANPSSGGTWEELRDRFLPKHG